MILDDPSTKPLSSSVNVLIYIRIHTKVYYDETTSEETVFFLRAGFSQNILLLFVYRKIASSNTSRLEAHAGFSRLLMKGIFYPYVL